jgi:hypothetical protein
MEYVAHSCCKPNKYINEMNDDHAYEMQVQIWEPNTWGVTPKPPLYIDKEGCGAVTILVGSKGVLN